MTGLLANGLIKAGLCVTDRISELHATDHVSESGVRDQQVRRPPVLTDAGFKVCEVPGAAHPGARECVTRHKNTLAFHLCGDGA